MSRIPIKALKEMAKRFDQTHLIVFGTDGKQAMHIATYGQTIEGCAEAADFGNKLKDALGWPESLHAQPSRVRALQREVETLKAQMNGAIDENTSDGYHTFKELYDHRIALFVALMHSHPAMSWRSKLHSDGTMFEGGWFIAGMNLPTGNITYHLPISDWDRLAGIKELERGPEWDGHEPADVVDRLQKYAALVAGDPS